MASTQTVWGIDLGRGALKAVKLRLAADGKVDLLAHEFIEHAKILSQPDADRAELINSALERFLSHHDLSKDLVVVGVPGQHTLARFTKLPPVAPKRIPDIVRYEADQQIPFDMDEVIWDFQTFQQEDSPDLEVGIFAMKRELIREHLLHYEQASIEPMVVQSGPLAVYNAAHFDGIVGDETTILLDIGAENTDLIIATKATFWTRTVPIGGNNFTEALVKSFKLSFSKAEALKRTADGSKYARQIFQAMRPIFADLVQELQRSIGFYSSTHRDTKIEKVVCFGNAAKLPGLQKYLQQNLGLGVDLPSAFSKANVAGGGADFNDQVLAYGVAYGLAVQGLDLGKVTSSLLPTAIAKQLVWRRKKPTFAAAAACVLLAGGLVWFRQSTDMSQLAAEAAANARTPSDVDGAWNVISGGASPSLSDRDQASVILAAGSLLKKELRQLNGKGDEEREQVEELIKIQHNKPIMPLILQAIHESLPDETAMMQLIKSQPDLLAAVEAGVVPPRDERPLVTITSLDMVFFPDINSMEVWDSMIPVPEPINDPDAALPAMKIIIQCTTPHKDGARFVRESFMDPLRKNGRKLGTGFYFDRVILFDGGRVDPRSSAPKPDENAPSAAAVSPSGLDPLTNEPIARDWQFQIWVDAVFEDFPADELDGGETEDDGG